ncbi:5-formyltetrahydrofolate cyclo-ligase [bacterium]|nr:5-formyltetrahydrofolate cyclo-ligase [bacterium]
MNKGEFRKKIRELFPHDPRLTEDFVERVSPFLMGNVLSYLPLEKECNIAQLNKILLSQGRLFLPEIDGDQLQVVKVLDLEPLKESAWNTAICHSSIPKTVNEIQTVLVPCLGVDLSFRRLGRGKGYYDRFLKQLNPKVRRISIVYKEQVCLSLPEDAWDEKVDTIFVF